MGEKAAKEKGVKKVSVPNRSTKSAERRKLQKTRWFKRGRSGEPDAEAGLASSKDATGRTAAAIKDMMV